MKLTEAQRDGRACIVCNDDEDAMYPADIVNGVQVFCHIECGGPENGRSA